MSPSVSCSTLVPLPHLERAVFPGPPTDGRRVGVRSVPLSPTPQGRLGCVGICHSLGLIRTSLLRGDNCHTPLSRLQCRLPGEVFQALLPHFVSPPVLHTPTVFQDCSFFGLAIRLRAQRTETVSESSPVPLIGVTPVNFLFLLLLASRMIR